MLTWRRTAVGLSALLLVVGCSSPAESDAESTPAQPESATPSEPDADATEESATPTPTAAPAPTATATPAPLVSADGIEEIELLTDVEGNDAYAILEWVGLGAVSEYTVNVFTADGRPWWAWSGPETSVPLGGLRTEADLGGPQAGPGVTWFVVGRDGDGRIVGVSARRTVA
jgi:hypothetical protein